MENSIIGGRYRLLNVIGSGGEARVFRAQDQSTENFVAVRLALLAGTRVHATPPDFTHENWVQHLGSGKDEAHGDYQVFELLEGQTLAQIVETAPLPRNQWRTFVDQSIAAVKAVHLVAVHGDVNADNFFLTDSCWKLLELPFFRLDPPEQRSTMFGSIYTLAPEQIDGAKPGVASDIYSLGCLYYYAASGTWPHTGSSVQEIAIDCLIHAPVSLRELAPDLPEAWCDWVMKLIAPKAADRCPSLAAARQLLADEVA